MTYSSPKALKSWLLVLMMACAAPLYAQDHSHHQGHNEPKPKVDHHAHHASIVHQNPNKAALALSAALGAKDRPERDLTRDASRQAELAFIAKHIVPGQQVLDLGAGGGYVTRIRSSLVGDQGHVTMQNPTGWIKQFKLDPIMDEVVAQRKNVTALKTDFDQLPLSLKPYNVILSSMIYHDTVWLGVDRPKMNAQTFAALQPGGIYIVIDHRAEAGSGCVMLKPCTGLR